MKTTASKVLRSTAFILLSLLFFEVYAQEESTVSKTSFTIGETVEFYSEVLQEQRKINVYLPHYYEQDSLNTYPIIYLLDGSKDEDFIHVAGLVQFGSFSWINMLPECIVIGVSNVDRKRDFTHPTSIAKDKVDFPTTGHSAEFIQFIKTELQPLVKDQYRCSDNTTLIGQSLGGLLATEILFKNTELFQNYIIVSPSMWWDNGSLLEAIPDSIENEKSIFIGVGKEGSIMEGDAMTLYAQLLKRKSKNTRVFFKFFEEQDHGDVLHLALYEAFTKLFESEK